MNIVDSTALVTGAKGGIGHALVEEALRRGVKTAGPALASQVAEVAAAVSPRRSSARLRPSRRRMPRNQHDVFKP
jgi:NAD(P)-dependent dehydrogenase (short-subunit alcohol dehydrogenase family)